MPYRVVKHGDKFYVMNTQSGETYGGHDSLKSAEDQQAALYAAEDDERESKHGDEEDKKSY